jgi:diphosphomevalonate decarboxylase
MTTARACANIALVKYWGKRDSVRNLPAAGSLSLTLAALITETTVEWDGSLERDELSLNGKPAPADSEFLDLVRTVAGFTKRARIVSENRFPTASGLASSASGFAALALAASRAAGLDLPPRELSVLARRGSGSAARSIFGGFVRMHAGTQVDGMDAYATPIETTFSVDVRMVIAIVGGGVPKTHGSRDAMEHCAATSPLYRAWVDCVPRDLETAEAAIAKRDIQALGELAEANALAMHASAIAARPAIIYWHPTTLALLALIRDLRAKGVAAWATMDAGPHVKVLTTVADAPRVANAVAGVDGVTHTMISEAGGPAEVIS